MAAHAVVLQRSIAATAFTTTRGRKGRSKMSTRSKVLARESGTGQTCWVTGNGRDGVGEWL
jgi:hypothetical protein